MALRGDALPGQKVFIPEPDGFSHSSELVGMISNLNRGQYLDPTVKQGLSTDFCIGVAAYPEKHFEAANLESDIQHLKQKVEAGADYIVTQMFFDNKKFFQFVELCRKAGITVPIIPGLKPISSKKQIDLLPRAFHIDIPQELVSLMRQRQPKKHIRPASTGLSSRAANSLNMMSLPYIIILWPNPTMSAKS